MILLVPVSRFSVPFEIGAGRPYSRLEELVCHKIMDAPQPVTLKDLRDTFQVHDRLLIESVVTLVRAGWAAMNLGEGLVITRQGRQALMQGGKPEGTMIRKARTTVYLERVCGLLERDTNSNLNVQNLYRLKTAGLNQSAVEKLALPVRNRRNGLSIGQTQSLLPHRPGEWIRWIGEPTMQTKASEFVPVHVDLAARTVSGLPRSWQPLLTDLILEHAELREAENRDELADGGVGLDVRTRTETEAQAARRRSRPVLLKPSCAGILHGAPEVEAAVRKLIDEASASLLIAVPYLDRTAVRGWEPRLKAAIARGVQIDVLWGRSELVNDGLPELKRISATSASGSRRSLRFNICGSQIVSQLILADASAAGHEPTALVGGGPLFGGEEEGAEDRPAALLRSAATAALLARAAAGWWAQTPGEDFCAAVDRWRRLAADWEHRAHADAVGEAGGIEAAVILDADCALLPVAETPEPAETVVVRGYRAFAAADLSPEVRGAVAVRLHYGEVSIHL